MRKLRFGTLALLLAALIGAGTWLFRGTEAAANEPFRLATVERGDVEVTVSATGTLQAMRSVAVGTQVSGRVIELYADYNDRVAEGQLLARIDPTLQQQQVRNAEAGLEKARAEMERAQRDHDRNRLLYDQNVITESEFGEVQYALAMAGASLKQAQINLEQARQNLAYTEIRSPIDGVVVERNAEQGQTVAASLSAPQLFLIANDLTEMEILATVDESDIGRIEAGQPVRFTVAAYPEDEFTGTVRQVRLASTTAESVVSYTAVISVEQPDGRLLPGMTASADILVERAEGVLRVPNSALRLRPDAELLAEPAPPAARRDAAATLYFVVGEKLAATTVRTGVSDGQFTEVIGEGLAEGAEVVSAVSQATPRPAPTTNPFQSQTQVEPAGGRPPF